jgi:hypothetical protein
MIDEFYIISPTLRRGRYVKESFEDKMASLKGLSEEEMAKRLESMRDVCKSYCGECPSYTGTGESSLVFCAMGKSSIITEEKGCLCPSCPVTDMMSLRWKFYCIRGSGKEQAGLGGGE